MYDLCMTKLRVVALALWAVTASPAAELTSDQWRADLFFLATELPQRHMNLFHQLPRDEWERTVKALDADIRI